jgi:putative glycosyl hydrolase-like family 15 (GHL15) protein
VLLAAFVTACSAGGGAGSEASTPRCAAPPDVGVPLAIRLPARPAVEPPSICTLVSYRSVFATSAWGAMPKELRAADPDVQVWQERSLLYACERCDAAAFRLPWIDKHHPEWILRTADGAEIHPAEHPGWVLLDFGDAGYQSAWSLRIQQSLTDGGWTGVDVADAGNAPEWSGTPVDPRTGAELAPDDRATYLAQALSLVHAAMRTHGFFLLAQNGPPTIVEPAQINSADALTTGTGFARLHGAAWTTLLRYYLQVQRERGAAFVFETGPDPGARRDVYGLAGYLLVATPEGAYGLAPGTTVKPLYDLDLGAPNPDVLAEQVGEAWTRTYPSGTVAVNPSDLPTELSLGDAGTITLPPGGAAIAVGGRLVTSY